MFDRTRRRSSYLIADQIASTLQLGYQSLQCPDSVLDMRESSCSSDNIPSSAMSMLWHIPNNNQHTRRLNDQLRHWHDCMRLKHKQLPTLLSIAIHNIATYADLSYLEPNLVVHLSSGRNTKRFRPKRWRFRKAAKRLSWHWKTSSRITTLDKSWSGPLHCT